MTLEARVFGRARLEDGRLTVRILTKDGPRTEFSVELATGLVRGLRWAEIDRELRRYGYERNEPSSDGRPHDGAEFAVAGWSQDRSHGPRGALDREAGTVALELRPTEAGEIRRAVEGLRDVLSDWDRGPLDALRTALDEADPTTVLLSASHAGSLWHLFGESDRYRPTLDEDAVRALDHLARHLAEHSRPVTGPWPHLRATLRTALREALTRPGAEGLAARDELLALVLGFAHAHRTATAADDEEQRRLQAERAEPEHPGPPR